MQRFVAKNKNANVLRRGMCAVARKLIGGGTFSVSLTGLTGGVAVIGTHASIGYTITPDNGTDTVKWSNSSNPADAATYGIGATPTDFTAGDAGSLYCHVTDGGETVTRSALIRYAAGTAPAIADGQSWTVDDTSVNIDASASGANLTWSYAATGLPAGVSINPTTGAITGTPTGVSSGTATVTATDQYGRTVQDTFTWSAALRAAATAADALGPYSWTVDDDTLNIDTTSDFTANGNTLSYVITGLPTGVSDDTDGTFSGTPTVNGQSGTITITATDEYGRQVTSTPNFSTAYRTQATGGVDLDLAYTAGVGGTQNLLANWTTNGNTLTLVSVSPSLPTNVSVNSAGSLTATSGVTTTADATYTLTMQDEYGRQTADTFTLEITAVAGTITFTVGTYTRPANGTSPSLNNTAIVATGTTGPYYLDLLSVTNGTTPSQSDMDAGSGTGVLEKVTLGPQALIDDLDGSLDLSVSITNGRIYAQYRDSGSTKSALTSVPTADSITYDAAAPTFSSAEIGNVDDTSLVITMGKTTYGSTSAADWDVQVNGSPATESAVAFTPGSTSIDVTLGAAVTAGQTVTVAYNGTGLVGVDGEQVATWTAQSVTNNVSAGFAVNEGASGGSFRTSGIYRVWEADSTADLVVTTGGTVSAILVGGGGAGGNRGGGGGGAGEYLHRNADLALSATTYTATVGAGAATNTTTGAAGANGSNTSFASITVEGGNGGGGLNGSPNGTASGSGGGAGDGSTNLTGQTASTSGSGLANDGGDSAGNFEAGGGGGSGAAGTDSTTTTTGGNGGAGTSSPVPGDTITDYAGGGGGYGSTTSGTGAAGGGDAGSGGSGSPATANTGSGGGGGDPTFGSRDGGAGGSGRVVVWWVQ